MVAGARFDSSASFLGPVRRSYNDAIVRRQLPAACARSGGVNSNRTSFSACANVSSETSGPTEGLVPNAEGAPGGSSLGFCAQPRFMATAPNIPSDDAAKNCLRDFDMNPPKRN
jgi:hypothetical protein